MSTLPLAWGQGLSVYLDHYEYSCTEQLVSKGVAALVLTSRPEFGTVGARRRASRSTRRSRRCAAAPTARAASGCGRRRPRPRSSRPSTRRTSSSRRKDRGQAIPADLLAGVNGWLAQLRLDAGARRSRPAGSAPTRSTCWRARASSRPRRWPTSSRSWPTGTRRRGRPTSRRPTWPSTYRLLQRTADADRLIAGVPWSTQKRPGRRRGRDLLRPRRPRRAAALPAGAPLPGPRRRPSPPAALDAVGAAVTSRRVHSLSAAYILLALDAYARSAPAASRSASPRSARTASQRPLTLPAGALPRVAVSEAARVDRVHAQRRPGAGLLRAQRSRLRSQRADRGGRARAWR